jgi:hypothetical protein
MDRREFLPRGGFIITSVNGVARRGMGVMRRARVFVVVAVLAASGVTAVTGWLLATRDQFVPPHGDVREVIAAYLADVDAARVEYGDALVTASGVVRWSARRDEVTTRAAGERSPWLDELSKQAAVLIVVDDRHEILADFGAEHQRGALALRAGERVTVRGRHRGGFFTGVVYDGKALLTLNGCEFVR